MKYLLWKYPLPISYEDKDGKTCDPHPVDDIKVDPKMELIDVLIGGSLDDVGEDLLDAVRSDMYAIFNTSINLYNIEDAQALEYLTDKEFDYEISAMACSPADVERSLFVYGIQEKEE